MPRSRHRRPPRPTSTAPALGAACAVVGTLVSALMLGCGEHTPPTPPAAAPARPLPPAALRDRLVFTSSADSGSQIMTAAPDGTDRRRLTDGPGLFYSASASPDGRTVVATHYLPGAGWRGLAFVDAGTGTVRPVPGTQSGDACAAFAPTGRVIALCRKVALSDGRSTYRVMRMAVDGSDLRALTPAPLDADVPTEVSPSWSPDGAWIAFAAGNRLALVDADGASLRYLTPPTELVDDLAWSPDGRAVAVQLRSAIRGPDERAHVVLFDVATGERHALPRWSDGYDYSPRWAPDGARLVFRRAVAAFDSAGVPRIAADSSGIYRVNADGTGLSRLLPFSATSSPVTWSAR